MVSGRNCDPNPAADSGLLRLCYNGPNRRRQGAAWREKSEFANGAATSGRSSGANSAARAMCARTTRLARRSPVLAVERFANGSFAIYARVATKRYEKRLMQHSSVRPSTPHEFPRRQKGYRCETKVHDGRAVALSTPMATRRWREPWRSISHGASSRCRKKDRPSITTWRGRTSHQQDPPRQSAREY
jgi:hypothetical protein